MEEQGEFVPEGEFSLVALKAPFSGQVEQTQWGLRYRRPVRKASIEG
jgi:hypothetical protein